MGRHNLLIVIRHSGRGGATSHVLSLIKGLDKAKYNIFVACPPKGAMIPKFISAGAIVKEVRLRQFYDLPSIVKLIKIIKKEKIDIIHSHLFQTDFLACVAAKFTRIPVVSTIHGVIVQERENLLKKIFYRMLYRVTALFFDALIAVSQAVKLDIVRNKGVDKRKIRVIYSGIECKAFSKLNGSKIKSEFKIDEKIPTVGIVAMLDLVKGHFVFLEAASQVLDSKENTRFLVVGDGPLREDLKDFAKRLRVDSNVLFCGARSDVPALLPYLDIMVLSSFTEGLPMVLLEALSVGVPIVASNVGGIPEVITNGKTGILVPPGDSEALAHAIIQLLEDNKFAKDLGNEGRKVVREKFRLDLMIRKTEQIYDIFLQSRHEPS